MLTFGQWLAKTSSLYYDLKKVLKSLKRGLPGKQRSKIEVTIATRELIELAELISKGTPSPDIPDDIIIILRDVIQGREECAKWYEAQPLSEGSKISRENDSHRHFIKTLHSILDILRNTRDKQQQATKESHPEVEKKLKKSNKPKTTYCEQDKLGNLFSLLHLEEPSPTTENENQLPRTSYQAATTTFAPKMEFKLEKEDDDGAFATWCFLADLNDVRSFVKATWLEFLPPALSQTRPLESCVVQTKSFERKRLVVHRPSEGRWSNI